MTDYGQIICHSTKSANNSSALRREKSDFEDAYPQKFGKLVTDAPQRPEWIA
ncbi:hypothetical protein [Nostoc sp.]|uniref:hypothetical protein n=1 Tax=Nostoc sp. TaxID=1180 RepID=UPI002D77E416|nr:hypothetical protein [Nostoc sp.]